MNEAALLEELRKQNTVTTEPAISSQESQKSSQENSHANSQNSIIPNSLKVDTTQLMYGQTKCGSGTECEKIFDCKKKDKVPI